MTFRCPNCNGRNQANARFCLDCGEPLDAERLVPAPPAGTERLVSAPAWFHSRETWLGAGLLGLLIALAVFSAWQGAHSRQEAAYRQGLTDLAAHNWQAALTELWVAGDYADAPRRLLETRRFWTQLQALADAASRAEKAGAWGTAAGTLRQMLALDPLYPNLAGRLAQARQRAGVIVYRIASGPQAGVWWANGDGSDPRPFPAAPDIAVHGVSPDGRWAVYSSDRRDLAALGGVTLDVLDLESGDRQAVPLPPNAGAPGADPVRFRNDSAGFWWVAADGWRYYDFATGELTPITDLVLAADPQYGRLLLALPGQTTPVLGTTNRIVLADAWGRNPRTLWIEHGRLGPARISADGRLLLYQVRPLGGQTDQIWAVALPAPSPPGPLPILQSVVLATRPVATNGTRSPFAAAFLPLGPEGALRGLFAWPDSPLRQVSPVLAGADEFAVGELQLGPNVQLLGLRTRADGSYYAMQVVTPTGVQVSWLGYTPDRQRIVYLAPGSDGQLGLFTTTIDRASRDISGLPRSPTLIFTRAADPAAWTRTTGFAHDGAHILVIFATDQVYRPPGSPSSPAGLWSLGIDGTNPTLLVRDAREFWTPEGWLGSP
jgi:hypothetical protein